MMESPGEGYRWLEPGETIQQGDEVNGPRGWELTACIGLLAPFWLPRRYRRRIDNEPTATDPVARPEHYTAGAIECIDAIESALTPEQFKGFLRGNAMKYAWRAGRKGDTVEDLEKARWYMAREIASQADGEG